MKKVKKLSEAHTSRTQTGSGDYYGTGIKQKVGRIRSSYMTDISILNPKKLKTPPKNLA